MFKHEARTQPGTSAAQVEISVEAEEPVVLHWGLAAARGEPWSRPPESLWPAGTRPFDDAAVQTPFDGCHRLVVPVPAELAAGGLAYAFFFPTSSRWDSAHGQNYWIDLHRPGEATSPELLSERIVTAELEKSSWTLMHRYDLCSEMIARVDGDQEALALLFVWLRFSASRQLDWQRHYNTQPRRLTEAQDRLTTKLSALWGRQPRARQWVRWLLTTVGRGGEGQRIRDEILNIMHRHHIGEHAGHFLEQWHQKLHNNATPDDVGIARAYLAFLRSGGDLQVFERELGRHGITRERLASYERPITADPDFYPQAQEGLIDDFSAYLRLLESIHASADLGGALSAARAALGPELGAMVDELAASEESSADAGGPALLRTVELGLQARRLLQGRLEASADDRNRRDLLYVDGALLDQTRGAVERLRAEDLDLTSGSRWLSQVLGHVALAHPSSAELECLVHEAEKWSGASSSMTGSDQALHGRALAERSRRALGAIVEDLTGRLQPKAEQLGRALRLNDWAIAGFSEAVVRGSSLFALARLLKLLDPLFRREANVGAWQVICPGRGSGRVERGEDLRAVQGQSFASSTVLLLSRVHGEEEIPRGVVAVLTLDTPDLLSHAAVRARNQQVLFASCHDPEQWRALEARAGELVQVESTPAGDVLCGSSSAAPGAAPRSRRTAAVVSVPRATSHAVLEADYGPSLTGGKSTQLAKLRRMLPDLEIPPSVAVPFGVCELALEDPRNPCPREQFRRALTAKDGPVDRRLLELRAAIEALTAPPPLVDELRRAAREADLPELEPWEACWAALKRVWASKWTERAYHARRSAGIDDDEVTMAVLIQPVVEADLAFVLHTTNPSSQNPDELYGELVCGLGETLVGNDPGAPLSFVVTRSGSVTLSGYPSKSHAARAAGLFFRSDSNGEDLVGYSGAGLYDSVTTTPLRRELVDYADLPLLWDLGLRKRLLGKIAGVGRRVEQAFGAPQDIEGAVVGDRVVLLQARPQVGL